MGCCLFGDNPLSELMMVYWLLDPKEHISVKFLLKFRCFHSWKCTGTCRLQRWQPSCLCLNVFMKPHHAPVAFQWPVEPGPHCVPAYYLILHHGVLLLCHLLYAPSLGPYIRNTDRPAVCFSKNFNSSNLNLTKIIGIVFQILCEWSPQNFAHEQTA